MTRIVVRIAVLVSIAWMTLFGFAWAASPAVLRSEYLGGGLTIQSSGTPSLNGLYSVDAAAQPKIEAISIYILANNRFPAGQAALPWADLQGSVHFFQSPVQFQAFATAVADYVAAVELALLQQNGAFPAASATIP